MKILLASHNAKKIQEIQEIFDLPGVEWVSAAAFPDVPEVVEDLLTFEGNATKKARELALATGLWTLADDSGLEVEALHHAPGVFSARYAGEPCNHANNNAKLIIDHVIDSTALESAGSYPVDLVNGLEEAFKNSIAKQLEEAKANPDIPEVEVMIRAGRIRETLKDEMLDVVKPDLVLCGARGLSSIKYALLGSISTFLLRNTDCDILVVK